MKKTKGNAVRISFILSMIVFLFTAQAQGPGGQRGQGGPGGGKGKQMSPEQAVQNNIKMLTGIRANPDMKTRALERLKERMESMNAQDTESRLSEIGKVMDSAVAMSGSEFEKKKKDLSLQIISIVRGESKQNSENGKTAEDNTRQQKSIPWIDVHNHFKEKKDYQAAVKSALEYMDRAGCEKMILMPPPNNGSLPSTDYDDFIQAIKPHKDKLAFLGGGSKLNIMIHQAGKQSTVSTKQKKQFEKTAEEILKSGAVGFGEMSVRHLSLHGPRHPYEDVAADNPLFLLLADIAAKHDVPIDIHLDVATEDMPLPEALSKNKNNPDTLPANIAGFERLLAHNPKTKILWEHAGSDNTGHGTVELFRRFLEKYPNLYLGLRLGPGHFPDNFQFTKDRQLKPEWLQLFKDFPTRFVIGSDRFFSSNAGDTRAPGNQEGSSKNMKSPLVPELLNALPEDIAHKIAIENAEALFKLKD